LLLICCLVSFAFLRPAPPRTQAPAATEIPATPTVEQVVDEPTAPSSPVPTLTVIVTTAPPDGWVEFRSPGAALWLPGNFVGGDMVENRRDSINAVNRLGSHFRDIRNEMQVALPPIVLWMVDETSTNSPVINNVQVIHEANQGDISLDQYVQNKTNTVSTTKPMTVYETRRTTLFGLEARRLVYEQPIVAGYQVAGVAFYAKDGIDFWILNYIMHPNQSFDMQHIVEQSASTFYIIR